MLVSDFPIARLNVKDLNIPTPAQMVERYQKKRKTKRFGQHFLTDPAILDHIIDLSQTPDDSTILEIGPGCGTLTVAILERGYKVKAIELDRDLCTFLRAQSLPNFELIEADAVKTDLASLQIPHVIANLPYNASTKILFKLLQAPFESLTLMFQKEVAKRICSEPHKKSYGSLSVICQLLSKPELVMELSQADFSPPPKVESAVVRFEPRRQIEESIIPNFEKFVRSSFAMKRKKLVNNLIKNHDKDRVLNALIDLELDTKVRAENVEPETFLKLFYALEKPQKEEE